MDLKLRNVGNSLGIILPKDLLEAAGLVKGDFVSVRTKKQQLELVLTKVAK